MIVPMLPPLLCEQLCSLNPSVDRLAYSVIFRLRKDGALAEAPVWYGRTVIRSCCKLDYTTAQRMIEGEITEEACTAGAVGALPLVACSTACLLTTPRAAPAHAQRLSSGSHPAALRTGTRWSKCAQTCCCSTRWRRRGGASGSRLAR